MSTTKSRERKTALSAAKAVSDTKPSAKASYKHQTPKKKGAAAPFFS